MRAKLVNKEYKKNESTDGKRGPPLCRKGTGVEGTGEVETRGEMEQETADSLHTKNSQDPLATTTTTPPSATNRNDEISP